jgi:hypothetical protein
VSIWSISVSARKVSWANPTIASYNARVINFAYRVCRINFFLPL